MSREVHVRFCEGLGVKLPRATRPVMGFTREEDAQAVLEALRRRCGQYGLTLHPEKTRIVPFQRPRENDGSRPGNFDFLGFTHFWGKSRRGVWVVKRKTASSRLNRALKRIALWCRKHRHRPLAEQQRDLSRKLKGHFAYYGITGNSLWLNKYRQGVMKLWRKWLSRRTRRAYMTWDKFNRLLHVYPLPPARAVHSIYAAKP